MGRHVPHGGGPGRARGPRACPARTTASRSRYSDGAGAVHIETTRPELLAACVALVAHPDDERYQPLFGTTVTHAGVRRRGAGRRPPPRRPGEGLRHRDDLHVRRPHRRHLVARARTCRPGRSSAGTAASCPRPPTGSPRDAGPRGLRADRRARPRSRPRSAWSSCSRAAGELDGEPKPITHPVKFFEKGDSPLEIVTTRQWYIRNGGRDADLRAELLARGEQLAWHPAHMAVRYENWVDGPHRRLADLPPALLRRADPAVVPRSTTHGNPDYDQLIAPPRSPRCPSTRQPTCPPGFTRPSAASRAASSATRTSWTPGRPRRLTPADRRRLGARPRPVGSASSRWTCARRPTRSSGPGCSPRSCARTSRTTACPGRTRRSPAGSSTRTARRCPSPRATSSRPWTCSTKHGVGRACATGRPPGARAPTPRSTRAR